MWLLLQVAFSLFQLGLWTPPVSADWSSRRPVLQAEDGRDLPQSRVLQRLFFFLLLLFGSEFTFSYITFCIMCLCRYWMGYLSLCRELQRRTEAFSTICQLDDISLLDEPDGKTVSQNLVLSGRSRIIISTGLRGEFMTVMCVIIHTYWKPRWYMSGAACYYTKEFFGAVFFIILSH